jgi:hypothetical protein
MNDKDKDRKDRKYFFDFGDVITTAHFMCRNCDTTVGAVPVEKDNGDGYVEVPSVQRKYYGPARRGKRTVRPSRRGEASY